SHLERVGQKGPNRPNRAKSAQTVQIAFGTNGTEMPEPGEMGTSSPKQTGIFGPNGREPAGSPRNQHKEHCAKWDKGTSGTRIAEKAESQSSSATCHRPMRDKEAHFGRIGRFCPKRFGTSGTKDAKGAKEPADQRTNQIITRVTRRKVKKSKGR
ncbi:hypothetical protein KI387_040072, partial [Taxus chinensis]